MSLHTPASGLNLMSRLSLGNARQVYEVLLTGLATGGIFSLLALALVMVNRTAGYINLAQGELATLSTFLAWQLNEVTSSYWLALGLALVTSGLMGAALGWTMFRLFRRSSALSQVAATIALYAVINSIGGFVWGHTIKSFPTPFSLQPSSLGLSPHALWSLLVTGLIVAVMVAFFRWTRPGLALRAAADNVDSARLSGISPGVVAALGWSIAAVLSGVAGILVAPSLFLEPNMMLGVLPFALLAAVVGGLASPAGAVLAGIAIGVIDAAAMTYAPVAGRELKLVAAVAVLLAVLAIRPAGLFAVRPSERP